MSSKDQVDDKFTKSLEISSFYSLCTMMSLIDR